MKIEHDIQSNDLYTFCMKIIVFLYVNAYVYVYE